ncbi:MAG: capsule biosynthesis protein, partial [Cyanobacteria bacterium K_DeepCast_35m_m2_023]|nr:capsule biosynthesis protein [Cyanobacteria bacterium K_DeepCast_35m_m2_023]
TKAMGRTFYNLQGLTDQQPLHQFWRSPQPSDRSLFYRFCFHLITTTQVNGNYDGAFPFRSTFPISAEANRLSPAPGRPMESPVGFCFWEGLALVARAVIRLGWLLCVFVIYGLQLLALALGFRRSAGWMLSLAAAAALRALGVQVVLDDSHPSEPIGTPLVHIWNHASPIDVLVVQGVLRLPSITTANLHLSRVMPWFARSAANAGHALMNHRDRGSRTAALYAASRTLAEQGQIMLAPNGSLVTSIDERVSASALLLARRHGALVVPWTFVLEGISSPAHLRYRPLRLLFSRLTAPLGTIYCRRGRAQDLSIPQGSCDASQFQAAVQAYYAGQGAAKTSEML